MAPKPDTHPEAAPPGLVDYVARFSHTRRPSRTAVFRAADEAAVMDLVLDAVNNGRWRGWAIQDVMTVEEAMALRGYV